MIYVILAILYILFTHFVADFVMQTHKMSQNKSTSIKWLTVHILSYLKGMLASAIILYLSMGFIWNMTVSPLRIVSFCLLNAALHWVTDYFTSKQTKKLWEQQRVHDFFVMIGLDQFIHATCLILTFYFIFFT
jgi:hypothetical protein